MARMPFHYVMVATFSSDEPLEQDHIDAIKSAVSVQIGEPCDHNGEALPLEIDNLGIATTPIHIERMEEQDGCPND